ncbi:MAG TPA: hypothetical protein VEJ63_18150 [Planctomycetota bacterium]|nr:hypothetical protein [Planctomycetota bacterium]
MKKKPAIDEALHKELDAVDRLLLKGKTQESIDAADKLLARRAPIHEAAAEQLGFVKMRALLELKGFDAGAAWYQEMRAGKRPRADDWFSMGRQLVMKSAETGLRCLDEAARLGCKDPALFMLRGSLLQNAGRQDEALDSYRHGVEFTPEDFDDWLIKGEMLQRLGKYREALECYARSMQDNPCESYSRFQYDRAKAAIEECRKTLEKRS